MVQAFRYPAHKHSRRHGPGGYATYSSYRDWLRDEFSYRCVYCLDREQWRKGGFHIDHFVPQAVNPQAKREYDNLVYSCATCNELKGDTPVLCGPDDIAYGECLQVTEDGAMIALSEEGKAIRDIFRLDNAQNTGYRRRWIRMLKVLQEKDAALFKEFMGYPPDLPDLAAKRPPYNRRPAGINESCYARRARNELPETY